MGHNDRPGEPEPTGERGRLSSGRKPSGRRTGPGYAARPPGAYSAAGPDDATRTDLPPVEPTRSLWPSAGEPPNWVLTNDPVAPLAGGGRTGRSRTQRRAESTAGRAGRNLPAAFAVGGGLGAAVVASLVVWRPAFLAIVAAAVAVGIWELGRAVRASGASPPMVPVFGGGVAMVLATWFWGIDALGLALLVTVLAAMVWRLGDGPCGYAWDVGAATLITVYVPFLAGFAVLLALPDDGHWRVLVTLGVVVLSDTGGYVAGVFFGRHPMAPTVSPKKSWEGLAGSLLAAAAGGAVGGGVFFGFVWWWGALFGLLIAAAAVLGDLAESMLKRDLGVKDMSGLLPGHGGLMDRLDSILFAAPTAYLLFSVLSVQ